MRPLYQDCTRIVLDLERVRPGPPDKGISSPHLVFTENAMRAHMQGKKQEGDLHFLLYDLLGPSVGEPNKAQ